ncbi:hypothetical protein C8Q75DRAFT_265391 [Abortiporus biennis]|nr:hypothetical protein C8Q75DRAFT_265391 [Abortiporus biennis]
MADPSLSPLDMTLVSPKFQKPYHEAGNDLALYNARRAIFHRADLKALQGLNPNDTKLYIQHRRRQPPRPQDHIFVNREIFTLASEQFEDFFSGEWITSDEYEEDSDFSDTESNPPEDLFDAREDEESEEEFEEVEVTDSEEDEEEEEPEVADGEVFDWDWRPPSPPDSEREFPEDDRLPISTFQSTNGHPSIKVVAPDWYKQVSLFTSSHAQ